MDFDFTTNSIIPGEVSGYSGVLRIGGTGALLLPAGPEADRPVGVQGYLRFNTDTGELESHNGSAWVVTSGFSGYSGSAGISGFSGFSGIGASGFSGYSGSNGLVASSAYYVFSTNTADSDPGSGKLKVNNADVTAATLLWVDYVNDDSINISSFLASLSIGDKLYVQDRNDSIQFILYEITSKVDKTGYYEFGVSVVTAGTSSFSNNQKIILAAGYKGGSGFSGFSGVGTSGFSGFSGVGTSGFSGYSGLMNTQFAVDIHRYGFLNQTETTISFDDTTFVFTLADAGAGWSYYRTGVKNTISGNKTVTIPGTPPAAGTYYIYIDDNSGTLTASTTVWTLQDTKVPVAALRFNDALTPKYWLAEERHSCLIDRRDHYYNHFTRGTQFVSGGAVSGQTIATRTEAAKTFGVSECNIADEDIINVLPALADPDGTTQTYVIFYRTGPSTWVWETSDMPFRYTGGSYIEWDNNGTMTTGSGSTQRYNSYLLFTNIQGAGRFVIVMGRGDFGLLTDAEAEDPRTFDWTGFPIAEWTLGYKFIWVTATANATKGKVELEVAPVALTGNISSSSSVGISGFSGYSGTTGVSGFSGYSGISGFSGFSGATGTTGASGFSGFSGTSGFSGFSGTIGTSGFSGTIGTSGFSGYSGAGASGFSGYSGAGASGFSGYSGRSGFSGYSGVTGASGFSGYSGVGTSGFSGFSGAGTSGFSGYSGAGASGFSGYSGRSGFSGYSGTTGASGFSGFSGVGTSGFSGYSGAGISGFSGYSGGGTSGFSGYSGRSGFSGYSGTTGASGFSGYSGQLPAITIVSLSADATANATTSLVAITGLNTTVDVGVYRFSYFIRYQSSATGTGVGFGINHDGTVNYFVCHKYYASTGTNASSGAASQNASGATGNIMDGQGERSLNTLIGSVTVSVDAANSNMLMVIEGIIDVTASGTLSLLHRSESAVSTRVMAGTNLVLTKVA